MARRAGGRAARVRARNEKSATPPIRPGTPGGRYQPLTESDMESVYEAALVLLETHGMGSPTSDIVGLVTEAGGRTSDDRILYPRSVVERAISTACPEFVWHGLDEDRSIEVGGDRVHFGTAGAAVTVLDHRSGKFRDSTLGDVYEVARLVDALDNIHFHTRTLVARDLVDSYELDMNTTWALLCGTTKPIGSSSFSVKAVYDTVEMMDEVMGGPGEFAKRPIMVANNTFAVPPLRFAEESAECLLAQVDAGVPVDLLSAGQAGATAPAALAGALTQALAECLAALTTVNLLRPGHPAVMGMWPFVSDLRTGAMSGGSGEEAVLNAAAAQLINWMGLPSGVAAGMSDSKVPDAQAGYEKALTVTLAGQAGANLVFESAGMLASLLVCSPEALVIDNDMLGSINRTIRGIEVTEGTLSVDTVGDVVNGAGHYLGHAQTLKLMQSEYFYPDIADRDTPANWTDAGGLNARSVAAARVDEILAAPARPIDQDIAARFGVRPLGPETK